MLNVIAALLLTFTSIDVRDPVVHGVMADLLRHARFGMSNTEEAAFLIRNAAGATFFLHWRSDGELNQATWTGPIPAGTVAILHTHPNYLPIPSNRDIRVAREIAIPVYVITRSRIERTDGDKAVVVVAGDWSGL
ncbi:MAG TPA: Mov34/MPN/PAD-1 family protein [Thermoanaerobaculia bacterium]|jgi:proteasome lid subunit RPN8/RPN11|nr:Mov34/MPN/PAD-1 family protein [Thermoanaerobaculia bacterium]